MSSRVSAPANGNRWCRIGMIIPPVWPAENESVESVHMHAAQMTGGSQYHKTDVLRGMLLDMWGLFDLVVGRFSRDDDVVHVALAQARGTDAHEAAMLLQLAQI